MILLLLLLWLWLLLLLLLLLLHSGLSLDATITVRRSGDVILVATVRGRRHTVVARVRQSGVVDRLLLLLLMMLLHLLRRLLHHRWNRFWVPWHLSDAAP